MRAFCPLDSESCSLVAASSAAFAAAACASLRFELGTGRLGAPLLRGLAAMEQIVHDYGRCTSCHDQPLLTHHSHRAGLTC